MSSPLSAFHHQVSQVHDPYRPSSRQLPCRRPQRPAQRNSPHQLVSAGAGSDSTAGLSIGLLSRLLAHLALEFRISLCQLLRALELAKDCLLLLGSCSCSRANSSTGGSPVQGRPCRPFRFLPASAEVKCRTEFPQTRAEGSSRRRQRFRGSLRLLFRWWVLDFLSGLRSVRQVLGISQLRLK